MPTISFCNQEATLIKGLLQALVKDLKKEAKTHALEAGKFLLKKTAETAIKKFEKVLAGQ